MTPEQQREAFGEARNKYKIIFGNRIAETSITINNVRVVVDTGEDLEDVYDQRTQITCRRAVEISRSSAMQRAGRAGRTTDGYCFRLYS